MGIANDASRAPSCSSDRNNNSNSTEKKKATFNTLFDSCRREFICTDTASLRTILTELETHDMLERRRGADAEEQIWIPLTEEQLKSVLDQISK